MIKILLLGVGRWGQHHLRVLLSLPLEVFVADPDESKLRRCLDKGVPGSHLSTDWQTFTDEVAAAVIVTPAPTHFGLCQELLGSGKDVFVEKPLTLSSAEARVLAVLAEKSGCILQVGHIFRYDNRSQWLYRAIREKRFGPVHMLQGTFSGFKRPRQDTGVAFADAIHFIDLFNYLMGRLPDRVTAQKKDFMGRGMEDELLVSMDYDGETGSTWAKVEAGYHVPGKKREVVVIGAESSAICDYNTAPAEIRFYDNKQQGSADHRDYAEGPVSRLSFPAEEPLLLELQAFLGSVQTRTVPLATGWDGYESVRVLEAVLDSANQGRTIRLNHDEECKKP